MEKVVDEAGEVEVNDGPPGLGLSLECCRAEVELEILDHGRLPGLRLACGWRGRNASATVKVRYPTVTHTQEEELRLGLALSEFLPLLFEHPVDVIAVA